MNGPSLILNTSSIVCAKSIVAGPNVRGVQGAPRRNGAGDALAANISGRRNPQQNSPGYNLRDPRPSSASPSYTGKAGRRLQTHDTHPYQTTSSGTCGDADMYADCRVITSLDECEQAAAYFSTADVSYTAETYDTVSIPYGCYMSSESEVLMNNNGLWGCDCGYQISACRELQHCICACGTNTPTTSSPTASPTTVSPTTSPTQKTANPTENPTTQPALAPTTSPTPQTANPTEDPYPADQRSDPPPYP
ncbi:hypothetical protein CYMTET_47793 [Cymbomonas tetramitiformis]|uniref:Uncharacterized protein n=1 Tax=Cymbomonas tetramitiformis TaxID=36881 RepID=A0AAE0BUW7_9CHLO|nr:hypothetical protein CYMTET_47793 [Cymbomonas tetramitiformis]